MNLVRKKCPQKCPQKCPRQNARGKMPGQNGFSPGNRSGPADLRGAAANIARASDEVASILHNSREPVSEFASTGLSEFTQLVSEARLLVAALTRISVEFERDPARYLFGDRQKGLDVK